MSISDRLSNLLELHGETPEDPFLWFALAKEYEKAGRHDEAETWFDKLINEAPDEIGTYYHYGKFLAARGRTTNAKKILHLGKAKALKMRDQKSLTELIQLIGDISEEE